MPHLVPAVLSKSSQKVCIRTGGGVTMAVAMSLYRIVPVRMSTWRYEVCDIVHICPRPRENLGCSVLIKGVKTWPMPLIR